MAQAWALCVCNRLFKIRIVRAVELLWLADHASLLQVQGDGLRLADLLHQVSPFNTPPEVEFQSVHPVCAFSNLTYFQSRGTCCTQEVDPLL